MIYLIIIIKESYFYLRDKYPSHCAQYVTNLLELRILLHFFIYCYFYCNLGCGYTLWECVWWLCRLKIHRILVWTHQEIHGCVFNVKVPSKVRDHPSEMLWCGNNICNQLWRKMIRCKPFSCKYQIDLKWNWIKVVHSFKLKCTKFRSSLMNLCQI